MKRFSIALVCLPTQLLAQYTIPEVRVEEPRDYSASLANNPMIYLLVGGLLCLIFAGRAYNQAARNKENIATGVGLAGALFGLAIFWPRVFGHTLPIAALDEMGSDILWEFFQTPLVSAGLIGAAAFTGVWYLMPQDDEQQAPSTATKSRTYTPRSRGPAEIGETMKVYKGHRIIKAEGGTRVDGEFHPNLLAAERAIDAKIKGNQQ